MAQDEKDLVPLTLRIPKSVHGRLKQISESEYRSLNHQIIMALSYFLDVHEKFSGNLPSPDHLRKAVPDNGKIIPAWLKPPSSTGARGGR